MLFHKQTNKQKSFYFFRSKNNFGRNAMHAVALRSSKALWIWLLSVRAMPKSVAEARVLKIQNEFVVVAAAAVVSVITFHSSRE